MSDSDSNKNHPKAKLIELQGEAKVVRKVVLIIFIVILLAISGIVGGGYLYVKSALEPVDPSNQKEVNVTIPIGSSPTAIANILAENGIVKNAKVFRYYTKFRNESGFQAGDYKLNPSMTFTEIIESLKTGVVMDEAVFQIAIPEGKQLSEIAKIISGKTPYSEEEIMKKLDNREYIDQLMQLYPSLLTNDILHADVKHPLEGYLFPATYPFFEEKPSLEKIIQTMIEQTDKVILGFRGEIENAGYSTHELLTMASLIEEEATAKLDREMIAGVFNNRLESDMPLQTDPTVIYALGEHIDRVYHKHLEVDSPYNTYKHKGLTPGPIANAGKTSIIAALNPKETDYVYFLATPEGDVLFSETLEEHNQKVDEHITNQ